MQDLPDRLKDHLRRAGSPAGDGNDSVLDNLRRDPVDAKGHERREVLDALSTSLVGRRLHADPVSRKPAFAVFVDDDPAALDPQSRKLAESDRR